MKEKLNKAAIDKTDKHKKAKLKNISVTALISSEKLFFKYLFPILWKQIDKIIEIGNKITPKLNNPSLTLIRPIANKKME